MSKKNDLKCCLGCGRDTTSSSGYCYRCVGKDRAPVYDLDASKNKMLEDDYSEESDANSCIEDKEYMVCRDEKGRYIHSCTD